MAAGVLMAESWCGNLVDPGGLLTAQAAATIVPRMNGLFHSRGIARGIICS
jgi:hypothetical protein